MLFRIIGALLLLVAASASPAFACKGPNLIFTDDFATLDPAWGDNDDKFIVGNKQMVLKPAPGGTYGGTYGGALFDDADICIDLTMPSVKGSVYAGLVFWHQDWDNNYLFVIDAAGMGAILRYQKGKVLFPANWRKAPSGKTTPGAVNTLRLKLKGGVGTAYINDQLFVTFKGTVPDGGGLIGTFGAAENGAATTWTFTNLKVTDVP